jgi:wyosine [tRNA(Phe)-imidazoG37] synthetase (radical SAM superfamily)
MNSYVFGPVPSRRLGRSLGIDLVPFKTCPFDCVYCQLGPTTHKTCERTSYVPIKEAVAQLGNALQSGPAPDYITLSGSGEPTLHIELDEVIRAIKDLTRIPIAVLTNGSLLWDTDLRRACAQADLVLPTLTGPDESAFQRIHRPCPGLTLAQHLAGLEALRRDFDGQIWLELFVVEGLNADDDALEAIASLMPRIRPDRIQLNTAVRPTPESVVVAASRDKLQRWASRLGPKAEVIADYTSPPVVQVSAGRAEDVLELCRRRPCTLEDIASALSWHRNEANKYIAQLLARGALTIQRKGGRAYFSAGPGP